MSRTTITLPDALQRALKEAAARRGISQGELVAESLRAYGIKPQSEAHRFVEQARQYANLDPKDALAIAVEETRAARG